MSSSGSVDVTYLLSVCAPNLKFSVSDRMPRGRAVGGFSSPCFGSPALGGNQKLWVAPYSHKFAALFALFPG